MSGPQRARRPDLTGSVTRDGVSLHYEVFGDGPTSVLLMPSWSIVDSRFWKAQVAFLARSHRVVTFDGRGCGRSARPRGAAAYLNREYAADTVAVLDATGTERCVLVSLSRAADWAVRVAATDPDRVAGIFAIGPSCPVPAAKLDLEREWLWLAPAVEELAGWQTYNREHWLRDGLDDFRRFFFGVMFCEPHSTKQIEDMMSWSADIDAETLADTTDARLDPNVLAAEPFEAFAAAVRCPVHVVHGTEDRISRPAVGEQLAALTGGSLTLIEGAGHVPLARDPVRINLMIRDFVASVTPPKPERTQWVRAPYRRRRALYLCSPIGLGHARRDIAIAAELRKIRTDLEIHWLAQDPVTRVLAAAGEQLHPASAHLLGESAHLEREAGEHDLHVFDAIRRMDETMIANFMVFAELVAEDPPDLVIADEAWEVDHYLHENPDLKNFEFAWLTDFVGWLPMPDGGAREAALTADYNAEMLEHRERYPRLRDRSIFVGNPDDVVEQDFGPHLPGIREWTERNYDFCGYVLGSPPPTGPERNTLRRRLELQPEHRLCVVTVGGTSVGTSLLQRILQAAPLVRRAIPELHFLVVTGPRIDPATLPRRQGVRVRGFVPDLADYLAACDIAVVQGGLSTCMELTSAGTPFVYVPLEHHFEQNIHVRHRLERYAAGRRMRYAEAADPDLLAKIIVDEMTADSSFRPVETDGAMRAAAMLAELL
ncbi:Pimeloyl-ACP methyl ester carboxylesterase [Mycolicibacterium rutilum]|uniref:Pimeloyl-ACP methyl ester carboxylesterase n=1 Tax=Mycolicibacterium rutilum TaxID=370526 RepID=A0A1H6KQL1_MYCRU|nr:alpha/beta hydrolase [Mycolicibacterium rutilum]SEH73821.1 Pimeloyl-ACP methyl ester carboxylesterase [Mycolicibacterium rutilum]